MVHKSIVTLSTLIIVALLMGLIPSPSVAQAQMACEARDKITSTLKKDYAEMPVSAGLDNSGRMIEVFASNNGSWTILITLPSGVSCLLATGESWMRREIKNLKESGIQL